MKFNAITSVLLSTLVASASAYDLLKDVAGDLKVGVAANTMKFNDGNYNNALKAFNMMVAENGCKLSGIQQQKGNYNFNDCDNHLKKAQELGMEFRGHCLVWHAHMPGWFEGSDANSLKNAIVDHVTKVLQHYEGKIKVWDVVNEAIDDNSSGNGFQMRNSFLRQKVPDFVDIAFQTARKVSPNTKLFYNDYNAEGQFPKSEAIYNFVADLKKRNIPIDGVGLQYHVSANQQPTYDQINGLIGRYCKLGLEVHITELDVKLQGNQNGQTQAYSNALKACLANSCCKAFLVWGVGDNDSWLGANEQALLFNGQYQPKPIYNTLVDILKKSARPAGASDSGNAAAGGNTGANAGTNADANAGVNAGAGAGANAGNSGNGNKTTKTLPTFATKTIPAGLVNGNAGGNKSKTIPVSKTIPPGAGGNSSGKTKTLPDLNSLPKTKVLPSSKTVPDMSNITIPKTKSIPNKTTKTAPKSKTIPAEAQAGVASKTIPKISSKTIPNLTSKTLPKVSKTLPNLTSKTLPKVSKTLPNLSSKTLPNVSKTLPNVSSKTLPKISSKTIPNLSSKTIPKVSKTLPNVSSKTLPNVSKTLPNISSKTLPNVSKTIPDVSGGSKTLPKSSKTIPKISSKTLPNVSKTLPDVSGASKTLPKSSKTIPKINSSKTLPKVSKTLPNTNATKTIPQNAANNDGNCTPVTVTVTVTVNSDPTSEAAANCVPKWGQCGGNGYSGPTCCQSGSKCQSFNEWYSQCV